MLLSLPFLRVTTAEAGSDPRFQCTPLWRIRLKARVHRADHTTQIYTQKYVKIRRNGRAYYFKSIKLCRLTTKVNTLSTGCAKVV